MNYTINEIPDEAVELSGNEMIPIWQGETKKVSVATLAGYVQDADSYSTTETLTGGKWIDGKPIYRKAGIYNNGGTIGTGNVILDSTLTRSYVDTVISVGGSAIGTVRGQDFMLTIGGYCGDQYRLCLGIGNNGLTKLISEITYTNFNWWIEYTKATD